MKSTSVLNRRLWIRSQSFFPFIQNPVFRTDILFIRPKNRVGAQSAQQLRADTGGNSAMPKRAAMIF